MGILDSLSGTKRPAPGTPVLGKTEVAAALRALNRPTAPFHIVDGTAEKVDLIAEWKIVDTSWYEVFARAGLTKIFRIYLKLDEGTHEVRAMDREYSLEWAAGVPKLTVAATAFKGQMQSVEFGKAFAFSEKLEAGQVYNYHFDTREIKKPIQDAVTACGWTYKGVAFGKL
jgi:hypothetical protein